MLSAFYSAGLAVPFLLTGLGINQFLAFYGKFRKHLHKVEVVSGVVLIIVGLLVMTGQSTLLTSSRLAAWLPNAEGWIKVKPARRQLPARLRPAQISNRRLKFTFKLWPANRSPWANCAAMSYY